MNVGVLSLVHADGPEATGAEGPVVSIMKGPTEYAPAFQFPQVSTARTWKYQLPPSDNGMLVAEVSVVSTVWSGMVVGEVVHSIEYPATEFLSSDAPDHWIWIVSSFVHPPGDGTATLLFGFAGAVLS